MLCMVDDSYITVSNVPTLLSVELGSVALVLSCLKSCLEGGSDRNASCLIPLRSCPLEEKVVRGLPRAVSVGQVSVRWGLAK